MMTTDDTFIFDTYAIIELLKGNKNYLSYLDKKIVINNFIFAELCYHFIKEEYLSKDNPADKYSQFITSVKPCIIKEAMEFRYKNKKNNMSMTDCISYFMAKELGIKFLTGDKEFESLDNVEFVKK